MPAFSLLNPTILAGTAWTGTAPGGTAVPSGTITTASDLSPFTKSVDYSIEVATNETTTFGSAGFVTRLTGLRSASVSLTFNQDFAASQLDQIIWTTFGGLGASIFLDIKATNAARSTTNPSFVCNALITELMPLTGGVGDTAEFSVSWEITGRYERLTA
jgi:hypothetical protein